MSGMSFIPLTNPKTAPTKAPAMQNSVVCCFLLFAWSVIFNLSLGTSSTPLKRIDTNRDQQLQSLKTNLLESLGLDTPPEPGGRASHQDLVRMYRQYRKIRQLINGNSSKELATEPERRASAILFPIRVQRLNSTAGSKQQLFRAAFQKDSHLKHEFTLKSAQLRIRIPQTARKPLRRRLLATDIVIQIHKYPDFDKEVVLRADIRTRDIALDLTGAVGHWLKDPNEELLLVEICLRKNLRFMPTFTLHFPQTVRHGKAKRALSARDESFEEEGLCRRKSVNVSFKEIGWSNWVIAPSSYTMHYCEGSCPHNYKPASMHTQIKSRLRLLSKNGPPGPCCVPAAYEPMLLMHYDSRGNVKLTPFQDLLVSKCHCA